MTTPQAFGVLTILFGLISAIAWKSSEHVDDHAVEMIIVAVVSAAAAALMAALPLVPAGNAVPLQ